MEFVALQQERDASVKRFRSRARKCVLDMPLQLRRIKMHAFLKLYDCDPDLLLQPSRKSDPILASDSSSALQPSTLNTGVAAQIIPAKISAGAPTGPGGKLLASKSLHTNGTIATLPKKAPTLYTAGQTTTQQIPETPRNNTHRTAAMPPSSVTASVARSRILRQDEAFISMNGSPLQLPPDWQPSGEPPVMETPARSNTLTTEVKLAPAGDRDRARRSVRLSLRPSLAPSSARQSIAPAGHVDPRTLPHAARQQAKPYAPSLYLDNTQQPALPQALQQQQTQSQEGDLVVSLQDLKMMQPIDDMQQQTEEEKQQCINDILDLKRHLNSLLAQIDPTILDIAAKTPRRKKK